VFEISIFESMISPGAKSPMMYVRARGFVSDETGGSIGSTPIPSTEAEVVAATASALAGMTIPTSSASPATVARARRA
jgi:hypothetical protein